MSDSPELRAIASTYLSEGAEVAYQLAFERMRALESRVAAMREAGKRIRRIAEQAWPTDETRQALAAWRKAAGDSLNNGKSYSTEGGER
jgi:hypothetical protein